MPAKCTIHEEEWILDTGAGNDLCPTTQEGGKWNSDSPVLLETVNGPAMIDVITANTKDFLDEKVHATNVDMEKVKTIVASHERRERDVATYLEGMAGDRPTDSRGRGQR